jgi:two-component sensor histidine kinase
VVTPIGLIVNELATNALKHAFTPGRREHFSVVLSKARNGEGDSQRYTLLVSNSGEPFPPEIDFEEVPTLGLRLVSELVAQLHGELQIQRSPETRIAIEMSLTPDAGS